MSFEMFSDDVLDLYMQDAGPLPGIIRAGREAKPLDPKVVKIFDHLRDEDEGSYVMLGMQPRYHDKRDLEILATVSAWNRAAKREGLRAQGCIFALRTIRVDGSDDPTYGVYIGRDPIKVMELDERAVERLANKGN